MLIKFKSIRKRLMFTVLTILLISIAISMGIALVKSHSVLRQQSLELNDNLVNVGADRLDEKYYDLNSIFQSIYLSEGFREYLNYTGRNTFAPNKASATNLIKNTFLSSLSSHSDIYSLIYVDYNNYLTYATREEAGAMLDYTACSLPADYIKYLNIDFEWSDKSVLIPTTTHMPLQKVKNESPKFVFTIARQIVNIESHFEPEGVMFITIDLGYFEKLSDLILPDVSAIVFIFDEYGNVVFDSSKELIGQLCPDDLYFYTDRESEHEVTYNNMQYMMVSEKSDITEWYVVTLIPEAIYTANAMSVFVAMIYAIVLSILVTIVITTIVSKKISEPIETLANTMDSTQIHYLEQRVDIAGDDEIARLSRSFNKLMDKLDTSIKNEYSLALRQREAEIRALQAQMNPHFLYNVLQSISSLAMLNKVPEIAEMANSLGNTLRYTISQNGHLSTVKDELENIESYLTIQKIRFGNRLDYVINLPEYLMNYTLPRFCLQPMVENAIVHGFDNRQEQGIVYIEGCIVNDALCIEVTDNGSGIEQLQLEKIRNELELPLQAQHEQGIGLSNLNARLYLLYGNRYSIEIDSDEGIGTTVKLMIPVRENK